jgi:hypothetical protein
MSGKWHLRFRRRLRVAPGIYLNLNKRSASASFGVPGAHLTVGPHGHRETIGAPGSGLFATRVTPWQARAAGPPPTYRQIGTGGSGTPSQPQRSSIAPLRLLLIIVVVAWVLGAFLLPR